MNRNYSSPVSRKYSIFKYQFSFHFYLVARSLSRNKSVIPSVFNKTTVSLSGLFKWRSGAEESILSYSPFWRTRLYHAKL
ncbi:unnamed protein product [Rhizophagus irregularis]|uniref:Uncharacterized protein n=1 Tax=Rhizophagus irregularis TaxID=588596 RepID=A0A916EBY1_9GLOM|nr:unnamed protein product [Rhizophagus irregularis]